MYVYCVVMDRAGQSHEGGLSFCWVCLAPLAGKAISRWYGLWSQSDWDVGSSLAFFSPMNVGR